MSEKHEPGLQPAARTEEEPRYRMNIFANRDVVIAALIEMEGRDWYERQPGWGEYSIDGALQSARDGRGGIIYGAGGSHRFYVRPNGDVIYSGTHGAAKIDQAQKLGFKLN